MLRVEAFSKPYLFPPGTAPPHEPPDLRQVRVVATYLNFHAVIDQDEGITPESTTHATAKLAAFAGDVPASPQRGLGQGEIGARYRTTQNISRRHRAESIAAPTLDLILFCRILAAHPQAT